MLYATVKEGYDSLRQIYAVLHTPTYSPTPPWLRQSYSELRSIVGQGRGECDVADVTVEHTRRLLASLPSDAPKPELAVDPDGQVALDWQLAPKWVLTATIAEDSMVYFAGLFGGNRYRGAEHFDQTLPKGLAASLERFIARTVQEEAVVSN